MPPRRAWLWFLFILLLNYLLMRSLFPDANQPVKIPYTLFKQEVTRGNVAAIYSRGEVITGHFAKLVNYTPSKVMKAETPSGPAREVHNFTTTLPAFVDPGLEALLIQHNVEISAAPIQQGRGVLGTLLFGFGPALLLIGFYVWLYRRAAQQGGGIGGGLMGIGRSRARRTIRNKESRAG